LESAKKLFQKLPRQQADNFRREMLNSTRNMPIAAGWPVSNAILSEIQHPQMKIAGDLFTKAYIAVTLRASSH